jgi:ADP-ribosylglycohydrolase
VAVAEALLKYESIDGSNVENFKNSLIGIMKRLGKIHLAAGFGAYFFKWLMAAEQKPYNSFGNGSAMRVSPVAWYSKTMEEALFLARASAEITHDHPEGIKGAEAVAGAIFLARRHTTTAPMRRTPATMLPAQAKPWLRNM